MYIIIFFQIVSFPDSGTPQHRGPEVSDKGQREAGETKGQNPLRHRGGKVDVP